MRQTAERRFGCRIVALVALTSFVTACATPATRPAPRAARPPLPPAAPAAPAPGAPPPPPAPTPSVGPREAQAPPPAPRVETPPPTLAPQPPTAPPVPPAQRGRFVVLNFDSADIETVVHAASEIVGFNYVLAPDVRGKVTVQTSGRIPQEDVFGVLLAILEVHGFTAVKSGNLYKIVRIEGARERAVPTIVGLEPDPNRSADEIITQIVPVRFSSVADLATLLRPLVSQRGNLVAHRETNVLMVTDSANNVRRLLDIIRMVDVEIALDALQIIQSRYAYAARPPGAETTGAERAPLIVAERRSNSLIVHARKHELETVRRLITQLDVNIYGGRRVFIYYAESGKAKDLAATLNAIYGARETSHGAGGQSSAQRPAGSPPPPPSSPATAPGAALAGSGVGIGELGVLEGQIRFIADEPTNSVIVTTFPRNWPEIEATIKQLDRQPRQVLVEVLVAEITLTDDLRLGVDWAVKSGKFNFASQSISTASPSIISPISRTLPIAEGAALTLPGSGLTAFAFATNQFMLLLNTLASMDLVNVLSNPHVLTSENKKAIINVSNSIPIVTSQQVPIGGTTQATTGTTTTQAIVGTQSVEYRDAGVILTVTPRIGEHGTVALDVKQEVNDVGAPEAPTGSRSIIKREAETSVVLMNNQTLVLGGLIRDRVETQDRGVPFMKDIPIIGYLFGAKVRTVQKTELLMLITPRVIGTALDAARITDEIRRSTPELEDTFRRSPRQPSSTPMPPAPSSGLPPAVPQTTSEPVAPRPN